LVGAEGGVELGDERCGEGVKGLWAVEGDLVVLVKWCCGWKEGVWSLIGGMKWDMAYFDRRLGVGWR